MNITTTIKRAIAIAKRDGGWKCHYCKCELTPPSLIHTVSDVDIQDGHMVLSIRPGTPPLAQVEHKIPINRGGSNKLSNLVLSCSKCNYRKHTKTDLEFIDL